MKPISRILCAALIAAGCSVAAIAGPPPLGTVLILVNGQVIEGRVDRVGERYRIVKDGGETWMPAARVQSVCADLPAAYQTLSGRIASRDADGRLRLARWCESVGLRAEAVHETMAALTIRPTYAAAQRYLQHLEEPPVVQAAAIAPAPAPTAAPEPPPVDVGAEALKRFTTKVQPLLMNACANCHAGPTATAFKLQRVYPGGGDTRVVTYWNLATAAAQIDPANPAASKLLTLATTVHGGGTIAPIHDKLPYKTLQDWVTLVAAERRPQTATPAAKPQMVEPVVETKVEKEPGPADPFDPTIFNRQHHPNPAGPGDSDPKRP
jgi:hypothetical protein